MGDKLFLGLDSSTQTLKAVAIDEHLKEVYTTFVNFDTELSHFGTYPYYIVSHIEE